MFIIVGVFECLLMFIGQNTMTRVKGNINGQFLSTAIFYKELVGLKARAPLLNRSLAKKLVSTSRWSRSPESTDSAPRRTSTTSWKQLVRTSWSRLKFMGKTLSCHIGMKLQLSRQ